jgi:hypothetical protein
MVGGSAVMLGNGEAEVSAIVESYRNGMSCIDGGDFEVSRFRGLIFDILRCMVSAFLAPAFPGAPKTWAETSHRDALAIAYEFAIYEHLEMRAYG